MTSHQENLKVVEAAVRKACPETMELKPGCAVRYWDRKSPLIFLRVIRGGKHAVLVHDGSVEIKVYSRDMEILGSPLGLPEILRSWRGSVVVDRNGIFYDPENKMNPLNVGCAYDLTKPLSDQDEPTIAFLAKLLKT